MAENNDNERAARILRARTEESTKKIYGGKLEIVVDWFRRNFPQYVVDNSLQYDRVPENLWEDLFTYLSRPKEGRRRRKRGAYLSFEHVSGYKSAIVDDMAEVEEDKKKRKNGGYIYCCIFCGVQEGYCPGG
jgi:hypothetical protein